MVLVIVKCDASFGKHLYIIEVVFYYAKTHKMDEQNMIMSKNFSMLVILIAKKTFSSSQ
jgi:hypothetical protein